MRNEPSPSRDCSPRCWRCKRLNMSSFRLPQYWNICLKVYVESGPIEFRNQACIQLKMSPTWFSRSPFLSSFDNFRLIFFVILLRVCFRAGFRLRNNEKFRLIQTKTIYLDKNWYKCVFTFYFILQKENCSSNLFSISARVSLFQKFNTKYLRPDN